jgi:hypothetical protein
VTLLLTFVAGFKNPLCMYRSLYAIETVTTKKHVIKNAVNKFLNVEEALSSELDQFASSFCSGIQPEFSSIIDLITDIADLDLDSA